MCGRGTLKSGPHRKFQKPNAGRFPWFPDPRQWALDYYLALGFFALGLLFQAHARNLAIHPIATGPMAAEPAVTPCGLSSKPPVAGMAWLDFGKNSIPAAQRCHVHGHRFIAENFGFGGSDFQLFLAVGEHSPGLRRLHGAHGLSSRFAPALFSSGNSSGNHEPGLVGVSTRFHFAGAIVGRRKYPYLLVGWLWYLGMFVPVIDIMQVGVQARADRYTYLPQIGLYIVIVWGTAELCGSWRFRRVVLGSVAGIIVVALMTIAYVQTKYWKNSVSLWEQTLAYTPQSHIAHCNLGIVLANQGQFDDAIQHFDRALRFKPDDLKAHTII